ncbi:DEAD/DEAH box helicase [Geomonas edaphica]|uniref:DEAD/DEAH box helicase n=1 Tax=Geomonas edaphica TaxID=2570226 RepID=UPI0013A5CE16|nr:DEAD/DEAH box helicase [Geomonas edaphica]
MEIRNIKGKDFVEAKEALTDSLLNLTYRFVSGQGADGEIVYGTKPSRKFVSGFLLPAMSESGTDDETSDIHISNLGMDLQVSNPASGDMGVEVSFAVYIRVLPTWEEIEKYQLKPTFQLRSTVQREIRDAIRNRTDALLAEEQGKPEDQRRKKALLRVVASEEIYRQRGIIINGQDGISELDQDDEAAGEQDKTAPEEEESSRPAVITAGTDVVLPDGLAQPTDIPQKWRRFSVVSEQVTLPLAAPAAEIDSLLRDFELRLWTNIAQKVRVWLASQEGLEWAYREQMIAPSQIGNQAAWDALLVLVRQTAPDISALLPPLDKLRLVLDRTPDFSDSSVLNVRVSFENQNNAPARNRYLCHDAAVHQVQVVVAVPVAVHKRLKLARIQPSFRFRNFMTYPALGINCGVEVGAGNTENVLLRTTWLPRYILPRITPRAILGIPWKYQELCDVSTNIDELCRITDEYAEWILQQKKVNPAQYETDVRKRHEETEEYKTALEAFERECSLVRRGIDLLKESQVAFRQDPSCRKAIPYRSWVLLNKTMFTAGVDKGVEGWRLFQEAFIIAHIPTIASRMEEFRAWQDHTLDEEMASLLYFSTGGGKSEAFYGLLIFNLFFDRLRGKHRGITSLIRYPLRLLTLQQAQRLFGLLAYAEKIKYEEKIKGAPFEIGFWVGKANTPNRNTPEDIKGILKIGEKMPAEGTSDRVSYDLANDAFNKVPICPYCNRGPTELRYYPDRDNRVGIICAQDDCNWNRMNGSITPLPFLLTDQDIYAHAPAIVLGTIDKLALIGQHDSTINKIVGMLGLARFVDSTGRLSSPRSRRDLQAALENPELTRVAPAFEDGDELFSDPFPSLMIQDEAHLLEESLGTFAGLFETAFEQLLIGLSPLLGSRVVKGENGKPRMPKVIAATATISTPKRQIEALYQRQHLQFPYPGTSLYESFYAHPQEAPNPHRQHTVEVAPSDQREQVSEFHAPWARVYASIMTNGRLHTVTTVNVLSAYHTMISKLWRLVQDDAPAAVELLKAALSDSPVRVYHEAVLDALAVDAEALLSLVDLFRISLTYVTNKKGGDQVIDALSGEAPKLHIAAGLPPANIKTELISGGVDVKTIQNIMRVASDSVTPDKLHDSLRNIVATSAISHGVDVDKFNAMFFAGTPTDIAEYIQASSRVGRTHVGFSLLIPVPQRRRDRYIVEVHDIFHRFLERMIAPAAIERWADNALKRVIPSFFQTWLVGCEEQRIFVKAADKTAVSPIDNTHEVKKLIRDMTFAQFLTAAGDFAVKAVGVTGRGHGCIGQPNHREHYNGLIRTEINGLATEFDERSDTLTALDKFWPGSRVARRPMTSLRDIDEAGVIMAGKYLPERAQKGILKRPAIDSAILIATRDVRKQTAVFSEMDNEGDA